MIRRELVVIFCLGVGAVYSQFQGRGRGQLQGQNRRPAAVQDRSCPEPGIFQFQSECDVFLHCASRGIGYMRECPAGTSFDGNILHCRPASDPSHSCWNNNNNRNRNRVPVVNSNNGGRNNNRGRTNTNWGRANTNNNQGRTNTDNSRGRTNTNSNQGRTGTNINWGRTNTNNNRGRTNTNNNRSRTNTNNNRGRTNTNNNQGRTSTNTNWGRSNTNNNQGRTNTNNRGRTNTNNNQSRNNRSRFQGRSDVIISLNNIPTLNAAICQRMQDDLNRAFITSVRDRANIQNPAIPTLLIDCANQQFGQSRPNQNQQNQVPSWRQTG